MIRSILHKRHRLRRPGFPVRRNLRARGHLRQALFGHHRSGFYVGLGLTALAFVLYARRHREQDDYRA